MSNLQNTSDIFSVNNKQFFVLFDRISGEAVDQLETGFTFENPGFYLSDYFWFEECEISHVVDYLEQSGREIISVLVPAALVKKESEKAILRENSWATSRSFI
jgi:hypothetical protein